jgi:nicotinate dehydrogenase subunit B
VVVPASTASSSRYYCAVVADIEVERASGRGRIAPVVSAVDTGHVVNPDRIVNQIAGGRSHLN